MIVLVLSTALGISLFLKPKLEKNILDGEYKNSKNILNTMLISVENQYQSILFHKEVVLSERKLQLQNVISSVESIIQIHYDLSQSGVISVKEAQQRSIEQLQAVRYQEGVGYIWINDTTRTFPRMIMHPTLPELNGTVLNSPTFNCALGKDENLFRAFVDVTSEDGEGFVDYLWPKPLPDGLSPRKAKLSYVKRFSPWGWIFGTGLYIDDIDEHAKLRITAVKRELQEAFSTITAGEKGYGFIFNSKGEVITHPLYKGNELLALTNPATGNNILDDLMSAADTGDGTLEYIWDKPQMKGQFRFRKSAYVIHYKPLDWYIATSYYNEQLEEPVHRLRVSLLQFSLIFIVIGALFATILSENFTHPLKQIINVSSRGSKGDYSQRIHTKRRDEFGTLSDNFNEFMEQIDASQKNLLDSEKRFRTLFEKSSEARLILENGVIVDCNHAAQNLMGSPNKSYLIGKTILGISPELQPDEKRSAVFNSEILEILQKESVALFQWEYIKYDGTHSVAEVQLTDLEHDEERVTHARWRDITDQIKAHTDKKRAEEQLSQMQKMETVGTLAGGFAHDFNNILNGIVGTLSLLRYELNESGIISRQNLEEGITVMEQSSTRAENMVHQLLTLSRKQAPKFAAVNLNDSVRNVVKLAQGSFDKSVSIAPVYSNAKAMITADAAQLEQIILNFCVNGAHSMTIMRNDGEVWGGTLTIVLELIDTTKEFSKNHPEAVESEYWRLSISDTGIGMEEQTLKKIFTPFFTTKPKGVGTGLGLSMVYNIVKQHEGFIQVNSKTGVGTVFEIFFPKKEFLEQASDSKESAKLAIGTGTILVIDDEPMMCKMATKMLEKCGYETMTAPDGLSGIEMYENMSDIINLVLLDMAMPGLSGKETFLALQKINPDIKVLLTSGFHQDERVQSVLSLGIKGFVQKPYDIYALAQSVEMILV